MPPTDDDSLTDDDYAALLPEGDEEYTEANLPLGDQDYPDDLPDGDEDELPDGDEEPDEAAIKPAYDCVGDGLQYLAALLAIGSAMFAGVGAVAGAVAYGAASGAAWGLGQAASDLSEDPPQPNYTRRAKARMITPRLPRPRTPLGRAMNRVTKTVVEARDITRAMVDALERYHAAKRAHDRRWMLIHNHDLQAGKTKSARLYRRLNSELQAVSKALSKTSKDERVDHVAWKAFQTRLKRRGLPGSIRRGLRSVGMSNTEVTKFRKWTASFYRERVKKSRLSYHYYFVSRKLKGVPGDLS